MKYQTGIEKLSWSKLLMVSLFLSSAVTGFVLPCGHGQVRPFFLQSNSAIFAYSDTDNNSSKDAKLLENDSVFTRRTRQQQHQPKSRLRRWASKTKSVVIRPLSQRRRPLAAALIASLAWFRGPSLVVGEYKNVNSNIAHAGIQVRCSNVKFNVNVKEEKEPLLAEKTKMKTAPAATTSAPKKTKAVTKPKIKPATTAATAKGVSTTTTNEISFQESIQEIGKSSIFKGGLIVAAGGSGILLAKAGHAPQDEESKAGVTNQSSPAYSSSPSSSSPPSSKEAILDEQQSYVAKFLEEVRKLEEEQKALFGDNDEEKEGEASETEVDESEDDKKEDDES
jgi:hypothetical protein